MHLHLATHIEQNGFSFSKLELRNEIETALLIAIAALKRKCWLSLYKSTGKNAGFEVVADNNH